MKYYAVTDDPRELYHYGVKGMKWGQHIFGPEPGLKKSDAYRKAQQKLKSLSAKATTVAKASSAKASKSVKSLGSPIKKSAAQASYNHRAKQQDRFNKSVARSEAKIAKMDAKIDRYFENKPIKDAKRQLAISTAKQNMKNAFRVIGSTAAKTSEQISYNVRRKQQEQYNKAVEKANTRNRLADAMRSYDQDQKLYKQAERERKIEALQEKKADVMADNDLKTLKKSVKVEKHMPKYYQQARTGMLPYGKLSDEQVERLQNRLALEWNTRRLGSTEKPTWREQKKMARREGYLQGITKGTAAAMEEVARAGVQYGIKNLANRKKLDNAAEQKAKREKQANRIKKQRTNKEIREDIKQDVYENRAKEGTAMFTKGTAKKLREAEANQRLRQNAIDDANAERKFLMDEKHNAARTERQNRENEAREERALDRAAKMAYEYGTLLTPETQNGKGNNQQQGKNKGGGQSKFTEADVPQLAAYYKQKYIDKETNQQKALREFNEQQAQAKEIIKQRNKDEKVRQKQKQKIEKEEFYKERERNTAEINQRRAQEAKERAAKDEAERQRQQEAKAKMAAEVDAAFEKSQREAQRILNDRKKQEQEAAAEAWRKRQETNSYVRTRRLPNGEPKHSSGKTGYSDKKYKPKHNNVVKDVTNERTYDDRSTDWSSVFERAQEMVNEEEKRKGRKRK